MKVPVSAAVTSTGISLPAGGTLKDSSGHDLTASGTATDNTLYAYDSMGKKIASFGITGNVNLSNLSIGKDVVTGRAWMDGLNEITNIGTNDTRELYVPFSQDTQADTVWVCENYSGDSLTLRESYCTSRGGTLTQWNTTEVGTTKNGITLVAVNPTDKYYEFKGLTASEGGEGGKGGEEEAVPEFTIITAIVAAVAGFGIYFVIRNKKK
jgi:hypothetical protein